MNSVRIVADSGCDLPPTIVAQYGIVVVPVYVRFGQEMIPSSVNQRGILETCGSIASRAGASSPPPGALRGLPRS